MNFTEEDRKFIRKIASSCDKAHKRLDAHDKLLSPAAPSEVASHKTTVEESPLTLKQKFNNKSTVNITFTSPEKDVTRQQILVESIYQTLKSLCQKNNISEMEIFITDAQNI